MAKCMNPAMSSECRGRVGGIVYNTWRGISYVKAQSSPAQPRSKLQLQIRAWTTYLVRKWATLGAGPIGNWNDYARDHPDIDWTNNAKRLSGINWYVRCNLRLRQNGYAEITEPPATAAPSALAAFAAADGILQSVITWTPEAGTDKIAEIWYVGPHTAGRQAKIERANRKGAETGESGTITMLSLRPGTYTFYGRVVDEDNGLASTWVSDTAAITAV